MLGKHNMFNMLVDVYIQYVVLVFKWFSIISTVQYLMLFRNVSYECFQPFLGGIIYDIYRIFNKMHLRNVSNHYECSIKCTLWMLLMNGFNHFGGIVYNICRIIIKMHF